LETKDTETIPEASEVEEIALLDDFVQGDVVSFVRTTQEQIQRLQGQFVGEVIAFLQESMDLLQQHKQHLEELSWMHSIAHDTRNDHQQFVEYYEILFDTISLKLESMVLM
jgi:hypothetical protein